MRCVNCALSSKVKYDYDANRMRVKKLVGTTATYFLYGLNGSLLGEYTPASQLQKEYFYLGSKLLAEREKTSLPTPTITYYHDDIVGSPIGATDKTGALAWREHYWPYGERNIRDSKAAKDTRWFAGKSQDAESKLSYFGARYYDPLLGRFMGIDPVGVDESNVHSHNRYAYGNNNPYKYVDPDGRAAETVWDVANLAMGVSSFGMNLTAGNYVGAAVDAVGVIVDGAATAVPFVPGGAGAIIKSARATDNVVDSAKGAADGARAGKSHTRGAVKEAKIRNAEKNNGDVLCETCGVTTTPTTRRTKGSNVDPREGQGDHIIARAKGGNGATIKDQTNIDIKCASCNNIKRDN